MRYKHLEMYLFFDTIIGRFYNFMVLVRFAKVRQVSSNLISHLMCNSRHVFYTFLPRNA